MNPGSPEAIKAGCECSIFDNRMGKGAMLDDDGKPLFWHNQHCKLHGDAQIVALETMRYEHPAN